LDLARQIAQASLDLYLPRSGREGRAHRYELLFRLAVDTVRLNAHCTPDTLVSLVAGAVLKRLDREESMFKPCRGTERSRRAELFAELVVQELYVRHCGQNVADFTRAQNAFANGVYFVIDQQLSERWERERRPRLRPERSRGRPWR
jgi:CRISPR type I-D-associated protein Csc3/Cas10d